MNEFKAIISKHKQILSALILLFAVFLIFWTVNSPVLVGVSASGRQLPIYSVQRQDKVVAISFDAAWGNEDTQNLIDILNRYIVYAVYATFFVVGDWVDNYPESVKALSDAGNEVMNHSSSHARFSQLTGEQIIKDIETCNDKIREITGVTPTLFRCPYGEYDDHVIQSVRSMGMEPIQWDVDSLDWKGISASEITQRILQKVRPGSIILFHNAAEHTPEVLPDILEALISNGYAVVPVSQILLPGEYFIDNTGMQCRP